MVDVYSDDGSKYFVKFKKGAKIQVPKAIAFDRVVAGQSKLLSPSLLVVMTTADSTLESV